METVKEIEVISPPSEVATYASPGNDSTRWPAFAALLGFIVFCEWV